MDEAMLDILLLLITPSPTPKEHKFQPVFSVPPWINLSDPLGGLWSVSWPDLEQEMNKLIKEELAELVLKLQSIEGIHTESSYKTNFDELFSQSLRDTRAAALTEAARTVVQKLSGMRYSVTVTRSQVTVGPILTEFSNLGVRIDVSICKRGIKKSVFSGVFTGEQPYSFERQPIETVERNRDDGDQPIGPDDHRSDGFSNDTRTTEPGSDVKSKESDKSFNDDRTNVSAQIVEDNTSVSIFG
jgi:hypothetical protein